MNSESLKIVVTSQCLNVERMGVWQSKGGGGGT